MNLELIKEAYAVIDGIPSANFDLNDWVYDPDYKTAACPISGCKTVACAGGWLSLHPRFKALGLKYQWERGNGRGYNDRHLTYKGDKLRGPFTVLGKVFNMSSDLAEKLFSANGSGDYDYKIRSRKGVNLSHKELFKYRVKHFLKEFDPTWNKSIY